jgi:hypothetical protein
VDESFELCIGHSHNIHNMVNPEDDEWEYEYDQSETEDFYIPIDLSNVPSAQIPMVSQGRPGHPTLIKSRLRALNAARGQPIEFTAETNDDQETATMGEVQVVGLHTDNPLVMYNGQLLSCQWTSTIGTDMFFAKPDSNAAAQSQPLRSLPSVDLLSLGSAKLVAKVGRLRPREDLFDNVSDAQPARTDARSNDLAKDQVASAMSTESSGATQSITQDARPAPTSFLEKLNQAKAKKGEKSRLVIAETTEGSRLVAEKASNVSTAAIAAGSSRAQGDTTMGGT